MTHYNELQMSYRCLQIFFRTMGRFIGEKKRLWREVSREVRIGSIRTSRDTSRHREPFSPINTKFWRAVCVQDVTHCV